MGWFDAARRNRQEDKDKTRQHLQGLLDAVDFSDVRSVAELQNYLYDDRRKEGLKDTLDLRYDVDSGIWTTAKYNFDNAYAQAREDGVASDALDAVYQAFVNTGVPGVDKVESFFTADTNENNIPDVEEVYPEYYPSVPELPEYDKKYQLVMDIDGDGRVDALTDSLLYLRYLFKLRGVDLTDGAVGPEATRTADEIEAYLKDPRVKKLLDFDKSGANDALTDALLALRYNFRLTDDDLTDGAVHADSPFRDDPQKAAEFLYRMFSAAFVLDDDGNITDEVIFGAADGGKGGSSIKDDAELDSILDRYNYQDLDTPVDSDGQTPEPEEPVVIDSDNDGVPDEDDAFPNDPNETTDSDSDGVGDNADAFPNDSAETDDSDNDGVGDNADAFPNDPSETKDTDKDGVGNNADYDPTNSLIKTFEDFNASPRGDLDGDGVENKDDYDPNNADIKTFDDWNATPDGDLDDDGVANKDDFAPDDPAITEAPQFEEDTDVGWPVSRRGDDTSLFEFNNGMATPGKTLYQGYSTPLTVDELIDGYLSIQENGTWTDPRAAKYASERAYYQSAGVQPPYALTNTGLETVEIDNPGGAMASAEQFLQEFSTGEFFFEGQRGGDGQIVNINYGRHPDGEDEGEFITLEDLFNARMPIIEGIGRPDAPLAPEFVEGVDSLPSLEELGNFYYDLVITAGYDYADAYMNAMPDKVKEVWDGRNKLPSLHDNPNFTASLLSSIGLSDLLEVGDLTKLNPNKLQEWVYAIEDNDTKQNAQNILDAVKKYQDDPSTLSYKDRHFLHVFKLMEPSFYGAGTSELEPLDLADDTLLDQISDLKTHQDIMSSWTNRSEAFPYVSGNVEDRYKDEAAMAPEDDPYWKPSTYGVSQLSINGGGLTFDGTSGLAYYIDGTPVDPNLGVPIGEAMYAAYGTNWLQTLPGKNMPLYQETDTLGAPAGMLDTYTTLKSTITQEQLDKIKEYRDDAEDLRKISPAMPMLEFLRKDDAKIAGDVGKMDGASKEELIEYFELQDQIKDYKIDFGGTKLWYDPTKLYMKTPQDDNSDYFPIRFNQEGQITNKYWVLDSYDSGYSAFVGDMPEYFGDFANPREENQGNGWLVDITGGNAPVGSYSMVWVAQPEYQDSWDRVLNDPFFNLFVSIVVPYGSIALASLKHLNGQTLKTEDWVGVVIDGLKLSGNLKLPASEAEAATAATESGEAARELAEAEAMADGFTGQAVVSMGQFAYDAAYAAEYATMIEGIGIAGLTAKQSVTLIRAMGSGDNLGSVILGSFGDEYITKALGGMGFDTSNLNPQIMDSVTNVATDMLDGRSFEEAVASEAGGFLVDYFEEQFDGLEASPKLKQFLETVKSELKDATDAVGSIAENLGESLEPLYDAVKDVITEEDIKSLVDGSKKILNSFSFITEGISDIATGIEKEMLDPLTDVFKQGLTKFTTMASVDLELTGDLDADLDKFFEGVGNASKATYEKLGEGLKEVFKESVGQQIVTGEINNDDLYKIFSRELVTVDAISKLDPDPGVVRNIVDAIGPQVLTSALRNTLNAAMAGGETDKVFLDTIAQSAVNALRTAHDAGGLAGVTEAFNDFGTKITGTYGEVKDAAKAYNDLDNQLTDLLGRRKALTDDLATAKQDKQTLEAAALAEGATAADIGAYNEFVENYVGSVDAINAEIQSVDTAMDNLDTAYTTAKNAYDNSVVKLTTETQRLDSAVQLQYEDLYIEVIKGINPDIKLGEYAAANNLPEGSTASDVAKHYLQVGAKEGLPVTIEEATARQMSAISAFAIGVFDKAGIDISALNNSDRAKVLNKLTEDANKAIEDEGISAVEYLENAVKSLETDPVSEIEAYVASALSSDPDNPASITQINEALNVRNAYMGVSEIYNQNGLDASQINNDMLEQIARGEVSYTVEYDEDTNQSKIVWGDDAPGTNGNWEQTEWDADEQRFVTYQYNSVSSTRVEVNAEGTVVGDREEFTPVDTTIDYFAEKNPTAYLAFLERADNNIALIAENRRIGEDAYTRAPIFNVENYEDIENIPDALMPGDTAAGRKAMRKLQAESDALVGQLEELNALTPNVPPEDLQAHNDAIGAIQDELEIADRKVHRTAQFLRTLSGVGQTLNNTWLSAKLGFNVFQTLNPAWQAVNGYDSTEEAFENIDFSMSNDLSETLDAMDALGNEYLADVYKSDLDAIQKRWEEADGFVESVQAVFGSFADYPATFATEFIALEIIEEALPLAVGGLYGKAASKAVVSKMSAEEIADLSPQIINNIFTNKSIQGALATDLTMAFGGAVEQTYQESYDNAMATGRYTEEEAQATAALMSLKAGTYAVSIIGMIPGSNLALDKAVLKGTTADAVTDHAKRLSDEIVDFGKVVTKETISEVLEETGVVAINELAYYNMGYDGETLSLLTGEPLAARDVGGNLGNAAAVSAIASAGTTSSILGIKKTVDALTIDTNNPLTYVAVTQNPEIATAIEDAKTTGNMAPLTELLTAVGIASMPLAAEIYNIVDDQAHVTQYEAEQSFDRLGVEPTEGMMASAMTLTDEDLDDDLAYTLATEFDMTDTANSTGFTTAQHYDIMMHIRDMEAGTAPLDQTFNFNGDNMISEADVTKYIADLPRYEREQLANYDATDHEDTGVVEDLGGSLMNLNDLNTLKSGIQNLLARDPSLTKQQVIDAIVADPTISGLPGQVTTAVNNAFKDADNKAAFASAVVDKLVEDQSIKTLSESGVKAVLGDPDGLTADETGIFGVIESLKTILALGETDPATLAEFITNKIGTAGTFDEEGNYKEDGTGLLGALTAQGVLRDVAIAEIDTILGSAGDGTDANPPTGLYAIAAGVTDIDSAIDTINSQYGNLDTLYDNAITNLTTNLGSPATAAVTEMIDGEEVIVTPAKNATGLYALVGQAITAGAGAQTEAGKATTEAGKAVTAVENLLGGYVDFAAFETAFAATVQEKVDTLITAFGTPPVYQTNADGTVKRDAVTGEPLFAVEEIDGEEVIVGRPTGYHLDMYNAMQLQGEEQELAFDALKVKINDALKDVEEVSSSATATAIKNDVLDVYFPAKPDDYDVGRGVAYELDYIQTLMTTGQYDPAYDVAGEMDVITSEDFDAYVAALTDEQSTALANYNSWLAKPNAITPMLENITLQTGANFELLSRQVDASSGIVTDYIRNNVLDVIGKPKDTLAGTDASGIYKAIEEGDKGILDVLGELGTIEDGVLTGGSGILRDMQALGMDTTAINDYLTNTLGKPADGDIPASGIFAAVDANQNTLKDIETWFTGTINALNEVVPDLATETDKISQEDISKAITAKLEDVLLNTELTNATDISNAVVAAIGTPTDQLNYQALLEKEDRNEEEEAELARLEGKLYLATASDKISSKDIQDAVTSQLGEVLLNNQLITKANISDAVVAAIGDNEGQLNLATAGDKISSEDIQTAITDNLEDVLLNTELTNATDIANAVIAAIGNEDGQLNLATATDKISSEDIQKAITDNLTGVLLSDQLITSDNISDAVNSVIGTSEDQVELDRLGQLETRDDAEQAEFERLSNLLYLATPDDVLSAEELATAVQTDELKNVVTVDQLLQSGDISGAVNAAIGPDGLNLATQSDVLDPDQVAAAVTSQLGEMITQGQTVSADTIQDAIANQTVAVGQVVSAEQAGLATTEQLTEATQDLATSDDIQMLADLIGKPVNLLTQEDYILATNYLDSIEQDIAVAEADALRYDVTGDQLLTQQDIDLIAGTLDTGDYSQFADTAQFRDTATGMLGREQQLEAELAARDLQMEADKQAQIQRDMDARAQMQADMEEQLREQQKREEAEEMFMALNEPGRTRTTKASPLADIGSIYDFEDIFRDDKQRGFYGSASPYGDNFLDEILNPQQRASGGMVKDKTDEILKIIGDK